MSITSPRWTLWFAVGMVLLHVISAIYQLGGLVCDWHNRRPARCPFSAGPFGQEGMGPAVFPHQPELESL